MNTAYRVLFLSAALVTALAAQGRPPRPAPVGRGLPDGTGKDTVQRVCGSTCHGAEIVAGKGYSRDNWSTVVNGMISRGAKASASADESMLITRCAPALAAATPNAPV